MVYQIFVLIGILQAYSLRNRDPVQKEAMKIKELLFIMYLLNKKTHF